MNKSDKEFLASILEQVSDAIYTGNTSELDDVIKNLRGKVCTRHPDAPEGATHLDLNDCSESKWVRVEGDSFYYHTLDHGTCEWVQMDIREHNMKLEEL